MNAPKFTQPEWKVDGSTVYALNLEGSNRFTAHVQPGWATHGRLRTDPNECRAVAVLMHAAPELYEALTRIMPFVDDAEDVQKLFPESACSSECREAVKLCRAALAKAVTP